MRVRTGSFMDHQSLVAQDTGGAWHNLDFRPVYTGRFRTARFSGPQSGSTSNLCTCDPPACQPRPVLAGAESRRGVALKMLLSFVFRIKTDSPRQTSCTFGGGIPP